MSSILVRLFGFGATLVHGDTLVLDRWRWLRQHLPTVRGGSKTLLDVGCGSGAFTIGGCLRGYVGLGLSWDSRNQNVARERALMCGASRVEFEVDDVRFLDRRSDLKGRFDIVLCCENIEHIIDDQKLMVDIGGCLKPGGTLLLTAPSDAYRSMTSGDDGPFLMIEDGRHVRKGYSPNALRRLCEQAGFGIIEIGYVSGFVSQKVTALLRTLSGLHPLVGWGVTLPLRALPPILDPWLTPMLSWPPFTITLVARLQTEEGPRTNSR